MKTKLYQIAFVLLTLSLIASACLPPPPQQGQSGQPANNNTGGQSASSVTPETAPISPAGDPPASDSPVSLSSNPPHVDVLDVTHLTLGDGMVSSSPQRGYVYSCMTQFNGGGAKGTASWINADGATWDLTKKLTVDGSVSWPHEFTIIVQGDQRVFTGNDLPDHTTGNYPISSSDDAYQADRNPNSIQSQSVSFSMPANPTLAAQANCVGGEIGIMLSGVVIFNSFDADGRDAPAHEVQDDCGGHPQKDGFYHYHDLSDCIEDTATGHSALMGYAFDGFGIYGYYGEDGREVTNESLDECHGHTHLIEWNGQTMEMYHYHATREFPYVLGCFRGTPSVRALSGGNNGQGGPQGGQGQQPSGQTSPQSGSQGPQGGQPPQEAIAACANLSQDSACSINTPNGMITGTCMAPPQSTQLACMPQGRPPAP